MALDKRTFSTRTLTAIVFAAVMITGLFWNRYSFSILFAIIFLGCWMEFVKLMNKVYPGKIGVAILGAVLYIGLPVLLIHFMRFSGEGVINENTLKCVPIAIIFSLWVNDTMAYIGGSFFGKTPLSKISPKKTIEGTLIGIVLAVAIMTIGGRMVGYLSVWNWMFISLISAVAGTFGDLMESKLKRMAGVKDSGNILPGHGGFLDRFDSMLVAIPFVFVYWVLFMV